MSPQGARGEAEGLRAGRDRVRYSRLGPEEADGPHGARGEAEGLRAGRDRVQYSRLGPEEADGPHGGPENPESRGVWSPG